MAKCKLLLLGIRHAGKGIMPHGNPGLDWIGVACPHSWQEQMGKPWSLVEMRVFPTNTVSPLDVRFAAVQVTNPFCTTISRTFRNNQPTFLLYTAG